MLVYRIFWTRNSQENSVLVKAADHDDMSDLMLEFVSRKGLDVGFNNVYFLPDKDRLND